MLKSLQRLLPDNSRQYREETSQRIAWGHWFALFNIVLAILIASRYAFNADWPNTLFGKLYFFMSLLGHFSFVVFALYLLLIFPISFLIKNNRAFRGISVIIATIGLTVLLLDTEVFKRFYLHLSPLVWDLLVNPDDGELSRQWQLLFVPMPLILLMEMLYSRWCWNKLRSFNRQKWGKYVILLFVGCFSATHLLYAWADITRYRPISAQKANYPLAYPMTARSFLEKHNLIDKTYFTQTIETEGRADSFFLDYPKNRLTFQPPTQKINFLFVNLSGLKHSDIQPDKMPALYELAQQSRYLARHYTAGDSPAGGIASLFYSLSGRYVDSILNEQTQSVFISRLQYLDYQFGLFSHNQFAEPIYQRALFSRFKLPSSPKHSLIENWQHWLTQTEQQPFFSYLDLSLNEAQPLATDSQIAAIWQTLQQQNLLSTTLVLITADIGNPAPINTDNGFHPEKIQVPMLMYWQGQKGIYTGLTSHLDIVPTLMKQFLGVTSPVSDYAQGIDLVDDEKMHDRRWLLSGNYRWNVAIMPKGEQYHIDRKGDFIYYNQQNKKETQARPPLAMFLQLIQQSNLFVEK